MLGLEVVAVVAGGDPGLAVGRVADRQVGRVAAVGEGHDVGGVHIEALEDHVEADAAPLHVELGPLGHAVDVAGDGLLRQGPELVPSPAGQRASVDGEHAEVPPVERNVGRGSGRENGEVVDEVLRRRETVADAAVAGPSREASRYRRPPASGAMAVATAIHRDALLPLAPDPSTPPGDRPAPRVTGSRRHPSGQPLGFEVARGKMQAPRRSAPRCCRSRAATRPSTPPCSTTPSTPSPPARRRWTKNAAQLSPGLT